MFGKKIKLLIPFKTQTEDGKEYTLYVMEKVDDTSSAVKKYLHMLDIEAEDAEWIE
jgi:hypothetical protein